MPWKSYSENFHSEFSGQRRHFGQNLWDRGESIQAEVNFTKFRQELEKVPKIDPTSLRLAEKEGRNAKEVDLSPSLSPSIMTF